MNCGMSHYSRLLLIFKFPMQLPARMTSECHPPLPASNSTTELFSVPVRRGVPLSFVNLIPPNQRPPPCSSGIRARPQVVSPGNSGDNQGDSLGISILATGVNKPRSLLPNLLRCNPLPPPPSSTARPRRLFLRHVRYATSSTTNNITANISPTVSPAAFDGDIFTPDSSGTADDVGSSPEGVARILVRDVVAVADAVVLDVTCRLLTVAFIMLKPGLDRSGSDAIYAPPVGGLKRRTYLVLLASCAEGGSGVMSLRFPSWARFTASCWPC